MTYEMKLLHLMDVDVESSFLVLARNMGVTTRAKTWSYLLLGGDDPRGGRRVDAAGGS